MDRIDPALAPTTAEFQARLAEIAGRVPVPSPCVSLCRIEPLTSLCLGCRRTLQEIVAWMRMDDAARRAVWAALPGRDPVHKPA